MIGWKGKPSTQEADKPKGFDDFELKLGDVMRGERATASKSLLDVQRELRIKAAHIAAIEACDTSAFETPSFIAGYVRSYARYLGLDPEWAFQKFCAEAGYTPAHGMAAEASGRKPSRRPADVAEALANPNASFIPKSSPLLSRIDLRALGSFAVLALVAGGIGYGGWSVLQEVQRVNLAPVDQAPGVVATLDPLQSAAAPLQLAGQIATGASGADSLPTAPAPEALDRLYRPAALETPVLIARDGPISAIDPRQAGVLAAPAVAGAPELTTLAAAQPGIAGAAPGGLVRTLGAAPPELEILAVRPAWVRVTGADGSVIFEKVMDAGERFAVPKLEQAPLLRTGESGAIYLAVNGEARGPIGAKGAVTKNIALSAEAIGTGYALADLGADADLAKMVALADAGAVLPVAPESVDAGPAAALPATGN